MSYQGGYYLLNESIVRGQGPNGHTANDTTKLSKYAIDAVNLIQETPWAINKFTLDTIQALRTIGRDVTYEKRGKVHKVIVFEKPLDPKKDPAALSKIQFTKEEWLSFTPELKKQINASKAKMLDLYEEDVGVWRATDRIVNTAQEMSEFPMFYFPHNMDFRTRIYPIPTDLNPQSSDLSKGLLRFARGTRLGKKGLYWMAFTLATHYGEDKLSPDDRVEFAMSEDFLEKCERIIANPVANQEWVSADAPVQFLATAYEFVWARRMDDPESFISYLPGNLDGSCNGAQHLSIMSKDLVGAKATNCCAVKERHDLYLTIADRVYEKVLADVALGNLCAAYWATKMQEPSDRRSIVKRSVMTVPYGVTEYGVADFMIKDGHVDRELNNQWDYAKYVRDLIWSSINDILDRGRELQRWFTQCAVICASNNKPLIWETPAGSKVTQAYRNVIQKRVVSYDTKFVIYEEPQKGEGDNDFFDRIGMNVKKMGTSAPPNVVHSCDASHLQITTCRMGDAGIRDFSMIHDSFGCPFAHMSTMRDILRQSAVDMYRDDYVAKFKASVEFYSGLKMPEPPAKGTYDLMEILKSEFFFS